MGNRRSVALLRAGTLGLAVLGVSGLVLASGIASADQVPAPRFVAGNVKTCAEAGLSGTVLFGSSPDFPQNAAAGSGNLSNDERFLDVTINEGFTASGIAVRGGNDTYVYDGPFVGEVTIEGMRAPANQGGNIPQISHWFVCGMETPPTTPPATTAPPTTAPPTTAPPTTAPPTSEAPTTPPSETTPPVVPPPPAPPSLPTTGTRTGLMIGSATAMIGSGVLLILLVRHRRRFEA